MADEATATVDTADATTPEKPEAPAATPESTEERPLGPEGEKALEAFKARARKAEKEAKEMADRLSKIEEANKSESEKALDKARKEARAEAESEFQKERRSDRLEVAVAKHARELADVDDVVLNLQRGDTDDLFDADGKVIDKALEKALDGLLKAKPHLKAGGVGKPQGTVNGGEGEGGEGTTFNDLLRQQ